MGAALGNEEVRRSYRSSLEALILALDDVQLATPIVLEDF